MEQANTCGTAGATGVIVALEPVSKMLTRANAVVE
jgi:hypothetical protein